MIIIVVCLAASQAHIKASLISMESSIKKHDSILIDRELYIVSVIIFAHHLYSGLVNTCFCLFGLRLYVPVNNFSVMSGRSHRFLVLFGK